MSKLHAAKGIFVRKLRTAESALLMLASLILALLLSFAGRRVRRVMKDGGASMAGCKAPRPWFKRCAASPMCRICVWGLRKGVGDKTQCSAADRPGWFGLLPALHLSIHCYFDLSI